MKLYEHPVQDQEMKFVITEDKAYFVPLEDSPMMIEILSEIFDLVDPSIFKDVEERLSDGRIILGRYSNGIVIDTPLETSEYTEKRIKEIFGEETKWAR